MAVEKGDVGAMFNLGYHYSKQNDHDKVVKYYSMAIGKRDVGSMYNLGLFYEKQKDYPNMIKYYKMASKKGCVKSILELGHYYLRHENYEAMKKYMLLGVEHGEPCAMFHLGYYYFEQKKYNIMKKYYLMAIEKDNVASMYNFGNYFFNVEKNLGKAMMYWKMASEKGDSDAMCNLASRYEECGKYDKMKKYYLMAFKAGHDDVDDLKTLVGGDDEIVISNEKLWKYVSEHRDEFAGVRYDT